jgi:parallel beta-helix repeat protein
MKASRTRWLGVLLVLALLLCLAPATTALAATTWYVDDDGGADFTTIADAVAAASAGDTIIVKDGTYAAGATVDKSLVIQSENGYATTIVQGGFVLSAPNITIDGLTAPGVSIQGYANTNCTIINNNISGGGITLSATSGHLVADNIQTASSSKGIELFYADGNTVTGNTFSNNTSNYGVGIYLADYSDNNVVYGNTCESNKEAIRMKGSGTYNAVFKNNFINNQIGLKLGMGYTNNVIYLNNFSNNSVTNLDLTMYSPGTGNFWNSQEQIDYRYGGADRTGFMGNYWDDYAGSDADGDGIGDTPHPTRSATECDDYPLMAPFEQYFPYSSTTLGGVVAESYVSITVPEYVDVPLERGTTVVVSGAVDIDSNIPWQLDVEDEKTDNKGYMVSTEDDVLQHPMWVSHDATDIDLSTPGGGTLATGAGPESVAVEFSQEVEYTDPAGTYEITVIFTVFGTF